VGKRENFNAQIVWFRDILIATSLYALILKKGLKKIRYSLKVLAHILGRIEYEKQCPCCGYLGRFDSCGHPPRYGSQCPKCGSFERHRLLVLADQKEDFFTDKEVLHFAPETILSRIIGTRAKRYLTTNLAPDRADCILNIERIDQHDKSWDVVLCSHVFENVNDQAALAELHRILHPGAILVAMVPIIEGWEISYKNSAIIDKQDILRHFGQSGHVRIYGRDFRNRLKNVVLASVITPPMVKILSSMAL